MLGLRFKNWVHPQSNPFTIGRFTGISKHMSEQPLPGRRIGKAMLWAFWILFLGGLTLIFGNFEKRFYNPNQNAEGHVELGIRELSLIRNKYGHYVSPGKINGQEVTFMLDTGATSVAIPYNLGKKLGLEAGRSYPVQTANGLVQVYGTRIELLELGPIQVTEVRAALNPGMDGEEILLGMSVLKHLDFSQSGKTLTLRQNPSSH